MMLMMIFLCCSKVEFHGLDGYGGPLYIGTGCFHRREIICGRKFCKENKIELKRNKNAKRQESALELEEKAKDLAGCTYEKNTKWGSEVCRLSFSFIDNCKFVYILALNLSLIADWFAIRVSG